jgi:hypothetical protein
MVWCVRRQRRPPVAAQVRADDEQRVGEPGRDAVPRRVRTRMAVQEHHRLPAAAVTHPQCDLAHVDIFQRETFEHRVPLPALTTRVATLEPCHGRCWARTSDLRLVETETPSYIASCEGTESNDLQRDPRGASASSVFRMSLFTAEQDGTGDAACTAGPIAKRASERRKQFRSPRSPALAATALRPAREPDGWRTDAVGKAHKSHCHASHAPLASL